ncbi:c-type cytochrome [Nioella nitratireducens]|uniref:c-type cytochrome n=1 Tax=Nioella nitratireducens TaxID=1287720 RepID=UPI0008FD4DB4|nr:c-type cytochrome [Nioella nitratireducens]
MTRLSTAALAALFCTTTSLAAQSADLLARGEYLVTGPMGCGNCHTPMGPEGFIDSQALAGRLVEQNDMFTAISGNITPGGEVADWSDAELARAIREGIRPDGSLIGPPMPFTFYRHLSDTDVAAIVAYLRTVPAVENDPGESTYTMPLPPAYGPPVNSVADIPHGVTVDYGEYLAGPVAHCMECHTPMGPQGPMIDTDLGRGGFEFHGPWGMSVAPNLTSSADGLAGYSDAELGQMIRTGTRPDGSPMMPPMPYGFFANMTDDDLAAIILYLRSLPPLPDAG